jgi:hypothetical protein
MNNRHLRLLDIGWNHCGIGANIQPGSIAKSWSALFSENKMLQHIDLSYNKFNYQDSIVFAKSLKKN